MQDAGTSLTDEHPAVLDRRLAGDHVSCDSAFKRITVSQTQLVVTAKKIDPEAKSSSRIHASPSRCGGSSSGRPVPRAESAACPILPSREPIGSAAYQCRPAEKPHRPPGPTGRCSTQSQ